MRGVASRSTGRAIRALISCLALAIVSALLPAAASASPPANAQVTGVSVNPTVVAGGVDFEATATVRNKRETPTTPRTILFRIFPAAGGSGRSLATAPIPRLKGKAKAEVSATLQLSKHKLPGAYEIVACRTPKKNTKRCSPKRVRAPLTVVGQQLLEIAPAGHDFGDAATGTSSAPETLTVTNSGEVATGSLSVDVTGAAAQFATSADGCTGETLAPGATCTVDVAFAPATVGAKTASVVVGGAPGGSAAASLTGAGIRPADLSISPTPFDYGDVVVGSNATHAFTITNNGQATAGKLNLDSISGPFEIERADCLGAELGGGESCDVWIRFEPAAPGPASGGFTASADPGGSVEAEISGTGITPAHLTIAPTSHSFGDTARGSTAGPQTFTVTNTGEAGSSTIGTLLTGSDIGEFSISNDDCGGETLAGGESCTFDASFSPTTNGLKSASLVATAMAGGIASASLDGTGVDPANLTITPSTYGFGDTAVGQSSAAKVFKVENTGGVASGTIGAATLSTPEGNQFTAASNGCTGEVLIPGEDCNYVLQFAPTSAGPKSSTLSFQGSPGGTASATVSGTGVPPAQLTITPSPHDFGDVATGSSSAAQTFTVENTGGVDSGTLGAASIGAPDGGQFSPVGGSNQCTGEVLSPAETCTYGLQFSPGSTGAKSSTLSFSAAPGGNASAALSGTGITPANLTISATSRNFGNVLIGAPQDFTFTVTNTGQQSTNALQASAGDGGGVFSLTGGSCSGVVLASGQSCAMTIRFSPTSTASSNASLSVQGSPGGTVSATYQGRGATSAANLQIAIVDGDGTPPPGSSYGSSKSFGASAGNDFTQIWIRNTGTADALISNNPVPLTNSGNGRFSFPNSPGTNCPIELETGGDETAMTWTNIRIAGGTQCSITWFANLIDIQDPAVWSSSFTLTATPGGSITGTYFFNG